MANINFKTQGGLKRELKMPEKKKKHFVLKTILAVISGFITFVLSFGVISWFLTLSATHFLKRELYDFGYISNIIFIIMISIFAIAGTVKATLFITDLFDVRKEDDTSIANIVTGSLVTIFFALLSISIDLTISFNYIPQIIAGIMLIVLNKKSFFD